MAPSQSASSRSLLLIVRGLEDLRTPAARKTAEETSRWVPWLELLFTRVKSMASIGCAELATCRVDDSHSNQANQA